MKKVILVMIILSIGLQVACTNSLNKEMVEVKETENISMKVGSEDKTTLNRSEDLSDFVVELFGIDDAATIIFNDTALVGVVMSYDSKLTEDTKILINDMILEKDKSIKEVVVSDDKSVFNEVVNIINELMNGQSYDKYVKSISGMIDRNK